VRRNAIAVRMGFVRAGAWNRSKPRGVLGVGPHMRARNCPIWGRLLLYCPLLLVFSGVVAYLVHSLAMPGQYHTGPLPPITDAQRQIASELHATVTRLAVVIGERHVHKPERLEEAALFVEAELLRAGYAPRRQEFVVDGVPCRNLEATILGSKLPLETVVVGAHYDSAVGTPGADDNASGVAAMLYLAESVKQKPVRRTLRFVAFVNEEPPYFHSHDMGSVRYADELISRGENVVAMLSLETLGYYVAAELALLEQVDNSSGWVRTVGLIVVDDNPIETRSRADDTDGQDAAAVLTREGIIVEACDVHGPNIVA
jgi:hypothetical protein